VYNGGKEVRLESGSKGCICYLVLHTDKAVGEMVESLESVRHNYLTRFPCPVIAFHEAPLTEEMKERIRSAGVPVTFQLVELKAPPGTDLTGLTERDIGYRNMCRFFASQIFYQPALEGFDYYLRLDTDSKIMSPFGYDLFRASVQNGLWYGYTAVTADNPKYVVGLWDFVQRYVDNVSAQVYRPPKAIMERQMFYNNFEICLCEWFRNEPWRSYMAAIDEDGGIYRCRWGDAPIRSLGVSAFMPGNRIQGIPLHYWHEEEFNIPSEVLQKRRQMRA